MSLHQANTADFSVLLDEARGGNTASLGVLLERRRGHLDRLARSMLAADLQSRADDCDLVQEVAAVVCRQIETFQGDSEQEFLAWLRGILLNVFRNFARDHRGRDKRQVRREVSLDSSRAVAAAAECLPSPVPSPVEGVLKEELHALLHKAVDVLSPEEQWVLCARFWDALGWEDIGAALGISADAARHRWGGILQKLGEHLPPELFHDCVTTAQCSRQPPEAAG